MTIKFKTILSCVLFVFLSNLCFSQTFDKEKMPEYVEVNFFSNGVFVNSKNDYKYNEYLSSLEKILQGSGDNKRIRNSNELLNTMYELGYEFINVEFGMAGSNYYYFRKKK